MLKKYLRLTHATSILDHAWPRRGVPVCLCMKKKNENLFVKIKIRARCPVPEWSMQMADGVHESVRSFSPTGVAPVPVEEERRGRMQ